MLEASHWDCALKSRTAGSRRNNCTCTSNETFCFGLRKQRRAIYFYYGISVNDSKDTILFLLLLFIAANSPEQQQVRESFRYTTEALYVTFVYLLID